jgi:transposase InsO family protein
VATASQPVWELVQWDTSEHDWLEGRGEKLYLIAMIDDATSRLFARFVRHDSTEENMRLLWDYLEKFGRPLAFYTDQGQHVSHDSQAPTR